MLQRHLCWRARLRDCRDPASGLFQSNLDYGSSAVTQLQEHALCFLQKTWVSCTSFTVDSVIKCCWGHAFLHSTWYQSWYQGTESSAVLSFLPTIVSDKKRPLGAQKLQPAGQTLGLAHSCLCFVANRDTKGCRRQRHLEVVCWW